jgi:hypothetical protein
LQYLVAEGIVAPVEPTEQRWEPRFHWNDAWHSGYSSLYDEFRNPTATIEWCKADRARAEYYFSELFTLLRSDDEIDRKVGRYMNTQTFHRHGSIDELKTMVRHLRIELLGGRISDVNDGLVTVPPEERRRLENEYRSLLEQNAQAAKQ